MKAAAIPGLSNRNRSSFATGRWPSPRCSRHLVPGCGPQQQPTDATWLHPAVPPEPDTCPRSSRHHSYPKSRETTQSVQVIFAGALRLFYAQRGLGLLPDVKVGQHDVRRSVGAAVNELQDFAPTCRQVRGVSCDGSMLRICGIMVL